MNLYLQKILLQKLNHPPARHTMYDIHNTLSGTVEQTKNIKTQTLKNTPEQQMHLVYVRMINLFDIGRYYIYCIFGLDL